MMQYHKRTLLLFLALTTLIIGRANEGQDLFSSLCSPCHTIGKGRLVGPDLKSINEKYDNQWLHDFIQSSQTQIKSGDSKAIAIFNEYNKLLMPDQPLNTAQTNSVLNYIINESSNTSSGGSEEVVSDFMDGVTEENIQIGRLLFSGEQRLENGGTSCISCHKIKDDRVFSSGTLAKELTETYGVMGSAGVNAILKNPPFPAMAATYKNTPLTKEEIFNLTAYLGKISKVYIYQHPVNFGFTFATLGVIVFVFLFAAMVVLYFNRKRKAVNHKIHSRQIATIN